MSGRKNVVRKVIYSAAAVVPNSQSGDLSGSLTGNAIDCTGLDNLAIQLVISGGAAPTGTFVVQMTSDANPDGSVAAAANWTDLVFDTTPTITTTPDDLLLNIKQWPGKFIRLNYTRTSGTGTLTATMTAKQAGG